jgi:transcriptional regulator with XRE-family HTH domain
MTDKSSGFTFNAITEQLCTDEERRYFAHDAAIITATGALNDAMESMGVTRAELARRLERTPGFVSQVLSGNRNMTLRTFADLAFALGLQVRSVDLSPIGEMRIPHDAMDRWLDEGKKILQAEMTASTTKDRQDLALASVSVVSWAA